MKKHTSQSHQRILQIYLQHLRQVVGLTPKTCHERFREVDRFLTAVAVRRAADLAHLTPGHLVDYLGERSADYVPASLRCIAGSMRGFLRFAQQRGWIGPALPRAVPKIAGGAHNDLPVYLSEPQLAALLASWDRGSAQGRRDRALGLCLARLGLRAGELAALRLEDLHWRQGTLRLRQSKNGSRVQLPLVPEVGQALAAYLRQGRPAGADRHVFLCQQTARPLTASAVSQVIQRALRRSGIVVPHPGAHVLRHTLASHLVQQGASLKEVADLLRHHSLDATALYAHVDLPHLRPLAQPWPQEVRR